MGKKNGGLDTVYHRRKRRNSRLTVYPFFNCKGLAQKRKGKKVLRNPLTLAKRAQDYQHNNHSKNTRFNALILQKRASRGNIV